MDRIDNFKGKQNSNGFDKRPNEAGRKKKIYNIIKEHGYNGDDIRTAFSELGFYNESDLRKLSKHKDTPVIVKITANAFLNAIDNGEYRFIKDIIEQYIGKAKNNVDVTSNGETLSEFEKEAQNGITMADVFEAKKIRQERERMSKMTPDEIDAEIAMINKRIKEIEDN